MSQTACLSYWPPCICSDKENKEIIQHVLLSSVSFSKPDKGLPRCTKIGLLSTEQFLPPMPEFAQPWHGGFEECPGRARSGPFPYHTSLCISPGGQR